MKFIIKLFPEITIKSQSVRLRFIKILTGNIRNVLKHYDETLAVVRHWDNIEVRAKDENQRLAIRDALTRIPGIHHILEVEDVPFTDMHDIFEKALVQYRDQLEGKTFCVRVKRRGKHDFSSIDVERSMQGMAYFMDDKLSIVKSGNPFKICYSIEENEYKGTKMLQLSVNQI